MAYLKYYTDESERWPMLTWKGPGWSPIGDTEIELGIRRLARAFNLPLKGVRVRLTRGCRHSCAGKHSITINREYVSWLLIAHEVAHTYHMKKYKVQKQWHNRAHAGITDRFCAWVTAQGWHLGTLAHEVALAEVAAEQQAQHRALVAATPPPVDMRIAQREAQVARLTRKIKALTTRRGKALRSLAALKRVKAKVAAEDATFNAKCEAEERDAKGDL